MKYFWSLVAGMLVGASAGAALLYFNPLTGAAPATSVAFEDSLHYRFPADAAAFTHGGLAPVPMLPAEVADLWETTISATAIGMLTLSDAAGAPQAVASRLLAPSKQTELLTRGMLLDDFWLVTLPGRGSLFFLGESNVWPLVRDHVLPVSLLGRPWAGPRGYAPTAGPGLRGTALVIGATGIYDTRGGRASERQEVKSYSRSGGLEELFGELQWRLAEPATENVDEPAAQRMEPPVTDSADDSADDSNAEDDDAPPTESGDRPVTDSRGEPLDAGGGPTTAAG